MEIVNVIVKSPFAWGLAIGLGFFVYALFRLGLSNRELSRYKRMLSDKMEVEAELMQRLKAERQELEKENENLRVEVSILSEKPDAKIENELEILFRAEKSMVMNAPGFPAAWETAKANAADEIANELAGKSMPKRILKKLFSRGTSSGGQESLESTQQGES
jgi:dsDNA-specific endonuclease/ATPase MutS2